MKIKGKLVSFEFDELDLSQFSDGEMQNLRKLVYAECFKRMLHQPKQECICRGFYAEPNCPIHKPIHPQEKERTEELPFLTRNQFKMVLDNLNELFEKLNKGE